MASLKGTTVSRAHLRYLQQICHHFKFVVCVVYILSFVWISNAEMVCKKGFQNFAGETYPPGDIVMQEGETLDVYCSVNLTHPKARGYNASNLEFLVKKHKIAENLIRKEIINETTIRLRVDKMNESIVYLDCLIEKENGEIVQVCQKHVEVGHEPKEVEDFRCEAPGWLKLICTWRRPYNPVQTRYDISYLRIINKHRIPESCPEIKNHANGTSSCEWNRENANYRANEKVFHITVNGTNALNTTGIVWNYSIDHFSIVIPDAPVIESLTVLSPYKLRINYTFKYFEHFRPGLEHNITVCSEAGECNETIFSTQVSTTYFVAHEEIVPYAYTNYTVNIRLRSASAKRTDEFWSPAASATLRTQAIAPESPPKTDIGSFAVYHKKLQTRDIFVYWEQIPLSKKNGPNFRYDVILYENEIMNRNIKPEEINLSFAKFVNLSDNAFYKVDVYAANDIGRSSEKSTVLIPDSQKAPVEPQLVSKYYYTNGTYAVTWTPPLHDEDIVSYTVFRCNHPRPHQCIGLLKWDVVRAGNGSRIVYDNLPHQNGEVYQFAVSANTALLSSGIVWASCSLLPDRVPDRLKTVHTVNSTEDQIHIEWDLDCSYQDGIVEGFRIVYCQVDPDDHNKCGEEMSAIAMKNTTYTLKNLQPYSRYKIGITIQTRDGESQQSRPIYADTLQGAPSDTPSLRIQQNGVRNTSVLVSITPPKIPNGVIRSYKIWIYPVSNDLANMTKPFKTIDILPSQSLENISKELSGLVSNTNYSIQSAACTIKCSEMSEPVYVVTKIGATNVNKAPTLSYGSGNFKITWKKPEYLGGPVSRFEVMVEKNGKMVNNTLVYYNEGLPEYVQAIRMDCDSNTNLTAKVRAITILEDNQELYGDWSQEGYVACIGGAAGWFTWTIVGIALLFIIVLVGFAGQKFFSYYKECSNIDPKLPLGLDKELYPCNPIPSKRKNSVEDVHSFGKESLYPLQYSSPNNLNEDDGVLSGTKEFKKQRSFTEGILDEDNKNLVLVGMEDFGENNCEVAGNERGRNESPWLWQVVSSDGPMIVSVNGQNAHEIPTHPDQFNNVEDCLAENRMSPSALNPLLPDRINFATGDGDYSQMGTETPGQPYKKLGMLTNEPGVPDENLKLNSSLESLRNGALAPPVKNDYANHRVGVDDEFSSPSPSTSSSLSPNSPEKMPATLVPDVLTNNSYVKWTQLLPEFKSEAISNRQSSPYCQVGII